MSKELETLKAQRDELTARIDEMQVSAAEHLFEVDLEDRPMLKNLMEHLNKSYSWKTQNAAVIVTLYDNLKRQNKELAQSDVEETVIKLKGHELNGLYQALLTCEGTGIENARRFITMLTMVGQSVGEAMQELSTMNDNINEAHTKLATLEKEIKEFGTPVEKLEPELETNEAEK
jgi:DNA repair ATPase RecN